MSRIPGEEIVPFCLTVKRELEKNVFGRKIANSGRGVGGGGEVVKAEIEPYIRSICENFVSNRKSKECFSSTVKLMTSGSNG